MKLHALNLLQKIHQIKIKFIKLQRTLLEYPRIPTFTPKVYQKLQHNISLWEDSRVDVHVNIETFTHVNTKTFTNHVSQSHAFHFSSQYNIYCF